MYFKTTVHWSVTDYLCDVIFYQFLYFLSLSYFASPSFP